MQHAVQFQGPESYIYIYTTLRTVFQALLQLSHHFLHISNKITNQEENPLCC